jgi:hypothetical protein
LESTIRKIRIRFLKAQVRASRLYSVELASRFDGAATSMEKSRIARQYIQVLKQTHKKQFLLELLEREQANRKIGIDL